MSRIIGAMVCYDFFTFRSSIKEINSFFGEFLLKKELKVSEKHKSQSGRRFISSLFTEESR